MFGAKRIEGRVSWFLVFVIVACLCGPQAEAQSAGPQAYTLTTEGEQVTFVEAPQLGYVTKLSDAKSSFMDIVGSPLKDVAYARQLRAGGRHNIWTVENAASEYMNSRTIKRLKTNSRVTYSASMFSVNGESVGVIPEIVVRMIPGIEQEEVQALCKSMNLAIIKPMDFTTQEYLLEVLGPDAEAVFVAIDKLTLCTEVEWAWPNTLIKPRIASQGTEGRYSANVPMAAIPPESDVNTPGVFPNDEYFPLQWHLHNTGQSGGTPGVDINAPEAWEITTGDPNIIVAMLDNGFELNHPDLFENFMSGYDFVDGDDEPEPHGDEPIDGHGTFCAGLIAASGNNAIGVTGVTWNCKIMPLRIEGPDQQLITEEEIVAALRWAANHGADVISNSWATLDNPLPVVRSGIIDVTEQGGIGRSGKGCVVLGASGNNGRFVSYPARYPEVISVGATNHLDLRWEYSGFGRELELVAPSGGSTWEDWFVNLGKDWMWSTDITGAGGLSKWNTEDGWEAVMLDYNAGGGTSAACPIAAGIAALILSIEPDLTGEEVRHFLEQSAKDLGDPGWDQYYGWGRVDARAALDMVLAKRADLNHDCVVDSEDEAILLQAMDVNDLSADIAPAKKRDGIVDANDLTLLMDYMGMEIPELGLIAYWKLDETEGMWAKDSVGDNDGFVAGGAVWRPEDGQVNGALELDGIDDMIALQPVLSPDEGPFSVFAWIKGGGPGQVILSQRPGDNWLMVDDEGKLVTELKDTSRTPTSLSSETVITDGNWHRIGLVFGDFQRHLYVDGVEVAHDEVGPLKSAKGGLYIGAGNDPKTAAFWSGLIDDVKIYNRAVVP